MPTTIDDVRELALSLPSTIEKSSYGTPGFRVADKLFARIHDNTEWLVLMVDRSQRTFLHAAEPDKYFWTDHYENYDAVLANLEAIDREELLDLLTMAWVYRAPIRLVDAFRGSM
jgi:hypothetical protein